MTPGQAAARASADLKEAVSKSAKTRFHKVVAQLEAMRRIRALVEATPDPSLALTGFFRQAEGHGFKGESIQSLTEAYEDLIRARMVEVLQEVGLNVTGGSYSQITNIVAFSDGSNGLGTGIGIFAKATASYAQPTQASATTGYTDLFTYTSGSPLSLGAGPFTSTGEKGDHLVMMMTVADTASGGMTPTETLTVAWDEI
jgi:hypothetical protein